MKDALNSTLSVELATLLQPSSLLSTQRHRKGIPLGNEQLKEPIDANE